MQKPDQEINPLFAHFVQFNLHVLFMDEDGDT